MNKDMILGLVRHILTFGGGLLAGNGVIGESEVEIAVGALVTLIGVVWSAWQKKKPVADVG